MVRHEVYSVLDFREQWWNRVLVEGRAAAEEAVQDDAAAPNVHLGPRMQLFRNSLWRCIASRSARSTQE